MITRTAWENKRYDFNFDNPWAGVGGARLMTWEELANPPEHRQLRQQREMAQVTRTAVAEKAGLSLKHLKRYERGLDPMNFDERVRYIGAVTTIEREAREKERRRNARRQANRSNPDKA